MDSVGKSHLRKDALEKATGRSRFIDDYRWDNMIYVSAVRSPVPHASITGLDVSEAGAVPGFIRLITGKDVPGRNRVPLVFEDYPFLADDRVMFHSQAVALVAADTREAALCASRSVKISFRELPAVFDPLVAMTGSSPKLYGKENVFRSYRIRKGDVDKACRKAHVTVEKVYTTNYQVHAYLETQGVIAYPTPEGGMTVYGSMQCPFYVQDAVSAILGIPQNRVRIVQTTTGGAFGGKEDVPSIVAGHAALAAHLTGRPVKIIYDREEDFRSMSKRHPGWVRIKYAASRDGKITACEAKYVLDGGAYSTLSPIVLWRGTVHAPGPYDIPNVKVDAYAVATNKVPCGAFRGFGQPQVSFANESLIDELAVKLGMDPYELRKKNALKKGARTATGHLISSSCGLRKTMDLAVKGISWKGPKKDDDRPHIRRGVGMASSVYGVGLGAAGQHLARAGANVQVSKDGSCLVAVGNTEMGQGARTVLCQIASEALGIPYNMVELIPSDTTRIPDSGPTVASRTTVMSGNAILDACGPIRKRIDSAVRRLLRASPSAKVTGRNGFYTVKGRRGRVSYADAVSDCFKNREHMTNQGWYRVTGTTFDPKTGLGDAYFAYTFSTMACEVEVDMRTGCVEVKKFISAHDIGKAVNPQLAQGQIQGGALQGIGYALMENLVLREGVMLNPGFTGYVIPSSVDAPDIVPVIVEEPYAGGPFGAKGLGEPPLICAAPAIANAVYNATGRRIRSAPLLPEKIFFKEEESDEEG